MKKDNEEVDLYDMVSKLSHKYLKRKEADKKIHSLVLEINKIVRENFNGKYENQLFIFNEENEEDKKEKSKCSLVNISIKRGDLK